MAQWKRTSYTCGMQTWETARGLNQAAVVFVDDGTKGPQYSAYINGTMVGTSKTVQSAQNKAIKELEQAPWWGGLGALFRR